MSIPRNPFVLLGQVLLIKECLREGEDLSPEVLDERMKDLFRCLKKATRREYKVIERILESEGLNNCQPSSIYGIRKER